MLQRLGQGAAARHRWAVIAAWLVVAVVLGVFAQRGNGKTRDVFTIPGTQSQQAADLLDQDFPQANAAAATVVFHTPGGSVAAGSSAAGVTASVANLTKVPGVTAATDPLLPAFAADLAPDGTIAYSTVTFSGAVNTLPDGTFAALEAATAPARAAGVQVSYGGAVTDYLDQPQSAISDHADEIGLGIAVIILIISLGSLVSMAAPIVLALFALTCSSMLLQILEAHFTIGQVAPILGTMIGLGVGIDYSLFIVSRHRQNLADGMGVEASIGRAVATSGSAVLFAAITVCAALVGLALIGIPYVTTLGLSAALFVAVTVAAALTLLPALLGVLGLHINSLAIHHRDEASDRPTWSGRWAQLVARRPVLFCLVALIILLTIASPLLKIELGASSDADAPPSSTQRQAYDLITTGFGPGANGPLLVAVALPQSATGSPPSSAPTPVTSALDRLAAAVAATPGVKSASPPVPSPNGQAAIIQVTPTTGPNDPATSTLIHTLRDHTIPTAVAGTPITVADVAVGGATAAFIDLTNVINSRLVPFIGVVILVAFVLLAMVFRSLVVPLNAAVMNLLSIGAAYGFVVAVFQWGWGRGLIGLSNTVPIVAFVPVMMFAVLFGLSMDYEVFLLSRIHEDYDRTGDSRASVVSGLSKTARVITSAALIMISVFLSFVTNPQPTVKMIGLGMAVAVLVDATIVRMMLVPASMELTGRVNWWLPRWLDRVLPRIKLDPPDPAPLSTDDDEPALPTPAG